jgi:CRP-like cAMP-binding protein
LTPIQKRHLEALSEERAEYDPGEYLWTKGSEAKYAFIVVKGSVYIGVGKEFKENRRRSVSCERYSRHLQERMERERGRSPGPGGLRTVDSLDTEEADHAAGGRTIVRSATIATSRVMRVSERRVSDEVDEETLARMRAARHRKMISNEEPAAGEEAEVGGEGAKRKYKSRIVNGMEVLSRGHFLANVAEMIVTDVQRPDCVYDENFQTDNEGGRGTSCAGTGRHSSTLRAGGGGATVVRFGKLEFINFLDKHPGVLLSLLGTEIVV